MCQENEKVSDEKVSDEELIELLSKAYIKFTENQKPLDPEFAQILRENIFELF